MSLEKRGCGRCSAPHFLSRKCPKNPKVVARQVEGTVAGRAIRETDGTAGPKACGQEAAHREREQGRQDWRPDLATKGTKATKRSCATRDHENRRHGSPPCGGCAASSLRIASTSSGRAGLPPLALRAIRSAGHESGLRRTRKRPLRGLHERPFNSCLVPGAWCIVRGAW